MRLRVVDVVEFYQVMVLEKTEQYRRLGAVPATRSRGVEIGRFESSSQLAKVNMAP